MNNDYNDHDNFVMYQNNADPDTLGGDFEIPEDLSEYEEDTSVAMAIAAVNIGGGLSIVDNLTTINYSNRKNTKEYIVIHYTAGTIDNGAAAKANTNYFKSEYRGASAQLFVDMNPIIYRCVPDDFVSWHCGTTGTYYHDYCRNSNSIGIEICSYKENDVYNFKDVTIQNAIKLTRYLSEKYNIPRSNIIMHWHVTHKVCAAPFITNGKPNQRWENFLDAVFGEDEYAPIDVVELNKKGKVINVDNTVLNYRSGPGTHYGIIGTFNQNDILNITGENGDWYMIDNKGFVHKNYVKLIDGWCDDIRDALLDIKVINDKSGWTKYNEPITKGLAVQLVSNASDISPISSMQNTLVNEALSRVGDTHFRDGDYRSGTLNQYCLGFIYAIFAKCKVPYKQIYNDARIIKASDPSYHAGLDNIPLGAAVIWPCKTKHGHVGIYVGNGEVVHAYGEKGAIKTTIQKVINDGYTEVGWSWLGGTGAAMLNPNNHWAAKALDNLVSKNIITDYSQWSNSLDDYISKALYMALICNMVGGVSDKYKNRNIDHWGRNCLDTLCDKGIISNPDQWSNFDGQVTKDLALAIIYKAIKK